MNCFPCFSSKTPDPEEDGEEERLPVAEPKQVAAPPVVPSESHENDTKTQGSGKIAAKAFTFREMAIATKNFRQECLIFDDGFGKVYKGTLKPRGEVVAIKQLDRNGMKGTEEFLEEVGTLSALKHPNLTNLIGYCADGDQRILVYEYMPFGSLETRLLARPEDESPLDWVTRMKIATGAAQGLQCLHEEANPPLLYRDFRSSNILLDEEFNPKLCDFGLAKIAESGNKTSAVPPRAMGTYGYSAPEYASTGELTLKSDIYSFGVVLLELISGRRAIEPDRPAKEQNLVTWAQPIFRDPRRFPEMADPHLMLNFSIKSLNQAVGVAAMCLQEEPTVRPYITDVVTALSFLNFDANDPPAASLPSSAKESIKDDDDDGDKTDNQSENSSSNQEGDINNDDDKSDRSSNQEENVNNDNDDDRSDSSSDQEENVNNDNQNVNNDNDDDRSDSSSDHEENVNNDNDDDKSSSSPDHDDNDNRESHANVVSDQEDDENISETHDDNRVSSSDDNGNINDIGDDISGYSMADEDTALTIEIDSETSSSDILPDEDSGEEDDDDAEIRQKLATKSSNSEKGKMIEISDDESIYSLSSSRSSGSGRDSKLGEKKTTQKAKSTKKSSVGNSSVKKSKRWRRAKLVLNHETENR